MVSDCKEERTSGYLCSHHVGREVSWKVLYYVLYTLTIVRMATEVATEVIALDNPGSIYPL